jgi:hypothetical protein
MRMSVIVEPQILSREIDPKAKVQQQLDPKKNTIKRGTNLYQVVCNSPDSLRADVFLQTEHLSAEKMAHLGLLRLHRAIGTAACI